MEIKKVGIVGCGVMGSGIAQVCAQSGYDVVVSEANNELLKKGLASIDTFLTKGIERGKVSQQEKDSTLARIKGTTSLEDFSDCDMVIEAVYEDMNLKKKTFAELDKICPKHTILATNTSVLCVIEIAAVTSRQDKVLGLHFFNPVPILKLLEAVKTISTSEETLETAKAFGISIGKTVVVAKDTPGFIVNRLFEPFVCNAVRMLEAGIATAEDIDTAVRLGLNHPMGPLELLDYGSLNTFYDGACAIYEELQDHAYAPPPLLKRMVTAGHLGRKAGKGFYDYK